MAEINSKKQIFNGYLNTQKVQKLEKPLPPLIKGSEETFTLNLTESILDKIVYLCREFPTKEWSGVLFWNFEGSLEDIQSLKVKAFDFYPLDLGSATYTEFSHSPKFAGYIAKHPELMDARMGLIHSHNNMGTFFSGTDTNTLREMSPEYGCYLSLIVNNAGTYTAALGVKASVISEIKSEVKETISYEGLDYKSVVIKKNPKIEDTKDEKLVVLRTDCKIVKEGKDFDNTDFINSVNELKTNKENQSFNRGSLHTKTVGNTNNPKLGYQTYLPFKENKTQILSSQGSLETIQFITRLIAQSYFLEIANTKSFDENVAMAMKFIPKNLSHDEYSTMIYDMIDPLMSFMGILKTTDQIQLLESLLVRFATLKSKNLYYEEIYENLDSFYEQLVEEPEEDYVINN